jgi:glycosyltransferase involved in cell wall biosynthesis
VVEAKASGLPPLVAALGGTHQVIQSSGWDGVVIPETDPETWADQIAALYHNPDQLANMRDATQASMAATWPDWKTVLEEDLLPVWSALKSRHGSRDKPKFKGI